MLLADALKISSEQALTCITAQKYMSLQLTSDDYILEELMAEVRDKQ